MITIATALVISGCTHLETRPSGEVSSVAGGAEPSAGAQRGLSYALPMVQYDLKVTRALDKCPEGNSSPLVTAKVFAAERYVAGERFEIDYAALASIMKTTNFDVAYHESGTIKSVNASAEDKTGPVLTDVARIGLAVASVATGNPLAMTPGVVANMSAGNKALLEGLGLVREQGREPAVIRLRCTQKARNALAKLEEAKGNVKTWTATVADLTEAIERSSELAALRVLSANEKRELAKLVKQVLDAEKKLRGYKAELATAETALSATEEFSWPNVTAGTASHLNTVGPGPESLAKLWGLFELVVDDGSIIPRDAQGEVEIACPTQAQLKTAMDCVEEISSLTLALMPVVNQPAVAGSGSTRGQRRASERSIIGTRHRLWSKGVFVREPVEARLIICRHPGTPTQDGCDDYRTKVLRDKIVVAPQLGRLRLLPFTNGPFEDNELKLSIRANGLIDTFKYGEESSASAASSALATISEKVDASLEKMEQERRDDEKYARETRTWERTEAAALRAEELATLTFEIDQLKKQSERLSAEMALAAAQDSATLTAEQLRIDAEVKLLQSRVARLKAAAEFATGSGA